MGPVNMFTSVTDKYAGARKDYQENRRSRLSWDKRRSTGNMGQNRSRRRRRSRFMRRSRSRLSVSTYQYAELTNQWASG